VDSSPTSSQKYPIQNRAGGVPQAGKHLPGKCEALSSNPSAKKKKKKKSNILTQLTK
jgi:hypothetical protein